MSKNKSIFILILMLSITIVFVGCGNTNSNDTRPASKESTKGSSKSRIKIEDLNWEIDEGIDDGHRSVYTNIENKSKYILVDFKLTFKTKEGLTDDDKSKLYYDLKNNFKVDDKTLERIKSEPITMYTNVTKVINPDESASNIACYYGYGYPINDMDLYNMFVPDIATIKYVDDGKIHTEYYDFESQKYSSGSETEQAIQWSQTELGNKIPKPEAKVIRTLSDYENSFSFEVFGVSPDQFNSYIKNCKEAGYTSKPQSYSGSYKAENSDGYVLYIYYRKDTSSFCVSVDAKNHN